MISQHPPATKKETIEVDVEKLLKYVADVFDWGMAISAMLPDDIKKGKRVSPLL